MEIAESDNSEPSSRLVQELKKSVKIEQFCLPIKLH